MKQNDGQKLLSSPMSSSIRTEIKLARASLENYVNLSSIYINTENYNYTRQYYHVYRHRLECLRPLIERNAVALLGSQILIKQLAELSSVPQGEKVLIIGTLYKNQDCKPNILQDLHFEEEEKQKESSTKYISVSDELILEDDLQRIRLVGNGIDIHKLVTGVVVGLWGNEIEGGKFEVLQTIFASGHCSEIENITPFVKDRYIAFLSGLNLSGPNTDSVVSLQLAVDILCGKLGDMNDQDYSSSVERLIIAGNSLSESTRDKGVLNKAKYLTKDTEASSLEAVKTLDDILTQLGAFMDVDIMPGPNDPANYLLPQQPLHKCLFTHASKFSSVQSVPNPYYFSVSNLKILGTSGQNVDDVLRNTNLTDPLEAMESLIEWSHLFPTCPDTLGCYPFMGQDPFILNSLPHLFFAGNQRLAASKMYKLKHSDTKICLLTLPIFSETQSLTLFNLKDFSLQKLYFRQ